MWTQYSDLPEIVWQLSTSWSFALRPVPWDLGGGSGSRCVAA